MKKSFRSGIALPSVLIASTVLLAIVAVAVSSTVATRVAVKEQYYEQVARLAAEAGVEFANACLRANGDTPQWTDNKPLTPATDCSGNLPVGVVCPGHSSCYVQDSNGVRSTFSVRLPDSRDDGAAGAIPHEGTVEVYSLSTQRVARLYKQAAVQPVYTEYFAIKPGDDMQSVSGYNCPSVRTAVRDARDNRSYWIQKLADGRCWMLTNLAYNGGGDNSYGDTMTFATSSTSFTQTSRSISSSSNPTVYPALPSTSVDGGLTGAQYGYHYNWCATMGGQPAACNDTNSSQASLNMSRSVCPSGWRAPLVSEYQGLLTTAGITDDSTGSSAIRNVWLGQYGGLFAGNHTGGGTGWFWTSTNDAAQVAGDFRVTSSRAYLASDTKLLGKSVRCIKI